MQITQVNGIRLAYAEHGRGRPLVLVHGFAAGAPFWDAQVDTLGRHRRLVVYDARGHGASGVPESPEAYSEEALVDELLGLLRHLRVERACVGGLSMGGNVALRFGLAHPDRVDGVIAASAGGGSDDPAAWRDRWLAIAELLERQGTEAFGAAFARSPLASHYVRRGPHAERRLRALLARHTPEGLARVARGVQAARPPVYALADQLRTFHRPVLVLQGEHDLATARPSRFLAETLPDAVSVVLAGTGHLPNLEDPDAFNAVVLRFLERVRGS